MRAVPPNPSDTEVIQVKPDTSIIAALATNPTALQAYLAACDTAVIEPDVDSEGSASLTRPATRKGSNPRSSARAKATPKRTPAKASGKGKRTPKSAPTEWIVDPAWAGVEASPRMLAAALYWGIPAATCNKLKGDKLALSTAIGNKRGIPVVSK